MEELERDVRLIRRSLAKGFTARDAVQEQLEALPDVEDLGEWIDIEQTEEPEAPEAESTADPDETVDEPAS